MSSDIRNICEVLEGIQPDAIPFEDLYQKNAPVILRGLVKAWPAVQASVKNSADFIDYLAGFHSSKPIVGYEGEPEMKGRFFYNDDISAMNYRAAREPFADFTTRVQNSLKHKDGKHYYMGSTDLDIYFPNFRDVNDVTLPPDVTAKTPPLVSVWMGTKTIASAHYDMSDNIACCVAGRRRFTLFSPEHVSNLYPGPLAPTPGGQVVSMVDFKDPDLEKYPRFETAWADRYVAELLPGDAIFFPALWWHHVEGLDDFNALVNYWWNQSPRFLDTPMNTLLHGMMSLRDRPAREKQAWKHLFDYYLFGDSGAVHEHLPDHALGHLKEMDERQTFRLRNELLNRLNR